MRVRLIQKKTNQIKTKTKKDSEGEKKSVVNNLCCQPHGRIAIKGFKIKNYVKSII